MIGKSAILAALLGAGIATSGTYATSEPPARRKVVVDERLAKPVAGRRHVVVPDREEVVVKSTKRKFVRETVRRSRGA